MDRRAFLSSAAAAALAVYVSGGQAAKAAPLGKVRELGVLRVAVYKDNRPWSWRKDGKLTGIDVDLAQALAKGLGVRADIAELVADESADDDLRNGVWKGGLWASSRPTSCSMCRSTGLSPHAMIRSRSSPPIIARASSLRR